MTIRAHGIEVEAPPGCEARVRRRSSGAASPWSVDDEPRAVVHVSTSPLMASRGDFGSGVVETMGDTDVLVCLVELDPGQVASSLVRQAGLPRSIPPGRYAPEAMQRTVHGRSGAQVFFHEADRAFCIYAVLGSHHRRHELAPRVDRILGGLTVEGSD